MTRRPVPRGSTPGRPTLSTSRSVDEPTGNAVKTASNPVAKAKTNKKPWVDKERWKLANPYRAVPIETHLHLRANRPLPPSAPFDRVWAANRFR